MDEKIKVGACYVLYNEEDYIKYSLDSIYNLADRIYILFGVPFCGLEAKPDKTEEIVRNYNDYDKKIKIFNTNAKDESFCKNFLLDRCRDDKMDYCWVVDGDEIYDDYYMRIVLKAINEHRGECVEVYAKQYWRSLHHSPGLQKTFILFKVLDDLKIRIRCPSRNFHNIKVPEVPILHHYGLARTPEKVREKYSITKNRENKEHPFDLDKWMSEKFLAWEANRKVRNIFPFKSGVWNKTHKVPDKDIPEIMKKHKWYGLDCIK